MGPALHPAIRHDVDPVAQRIDDFRKLVECGARAVSLPTAVVRNDDAGAAYIGGSFRIFHAHDALQAELPDPKFYHLGKIAIQDLAILSGQNWFFRRRVLERFV
jgi:hypothetical protein